MNKFLKFLTSLTKKEVTATWQPMAGNADSRITTANLMDHNKNWVYVCVDKIADATSAIPLKLMRTNDKGKEDEEIYDHPALTILLKPNDQMTGRDFRYATVAHQELTGNAYWLKDKETEPTVLYPLSPKYTQPLLSDDKRTILNYKYRVDLKSWSYPSKMVFHLKYPNPDNPVLGRGTLEPIAEWVDVDEYATEFNRKFFINGATFGGMIESDASTKEAQQLIRAGIEGMHKGVANAHKIGILPKGAKFNESKMTPKDMEFSEADNRFRDKILAAFGVPKSVVGIVEDVNRANAESSNYVFMSFTVKPKMDRFITYLNEFFLPLFEDSKNLYFTYDDPTPENQQIKIQEDQAALGNAPYKTINEVRAGHGLEPITGGDVVYGNAFLAPVGSKPTDTGTEPAKAINNKAIKYKRIDKKGKAVDNLVNKVFELAKAKATKEEIETRHKEFINRVTTYEQKFRTAVVKHDQEQKQRVLATIKDKVKAITPKDLLVFDSEVALMIDFITPILGDLVDDEGTRTMLALGIADTFNPTSASIEKVLQASIKRMAKSYTRTTLDLLVSKINEGIQAGEGIDKISNRVSDVYGLSEEYRATRVARTEVFSAANDATREAYKQSGVVKTVKWVTAEDELTCEFCGPLDGKIVDVEQSFFDRGETADGTDGGELALDYEKVQNPPLHPNCRCFIQPEEISVKAVAEPKKKSIEEADTFIEELANILNHEEATK